MTDTDVTLYQLTAPTPRSSRTTGSSHWNCAPTTRPRAPPSASSPATGRRSTPATSTGSSYRLKEGDWTWKDSVRYTPPCHTIGGTSGSPVIDTATGKVVAVNNTGNEDGERCTDQQPVRGGRERQRHRAPGHQLRRGDLRIPACVTPGSRIDLTLPGPHAAAPRPAGGRWNPFRTVPAIPAPGDVRGTPCRGGAVPPRHAHVRGGTAPPRCPAAGRPGGPGPAVAAHPLWSGRGTRSTRSPTTTRRRHSGGDECGRYRKRHGDG